jgi:predicted phosphatase
MILGVFIHHRRISFIEEEHYPYKEKILLQQIKHINGSRRLFVCSRGLVF